MRIIAFAFSFISLLSFSQVRVDLGLGASYRLGPDYFTGMDGKISDQAKLSTTLQMTYSPFTNGFHHLGLGLSYQLYGLKSTVIEYPWVNTGGSGGGIPGYDQWQIVNWESIGLPIVYTYTKNKWAVTAQAALTYTYAKVLTETRDYHSDLDTYKNEAIVVPTRDFGQYMNIALSGGVSYAVNSKPPVPLQIGVRVFGVLPFSKYNYGSGRIPIGGLLVASYTLNWSSDDS